MTFSATKLAALVYADGFTDWRYKSTADTLATIMAAGYFTGDALDKLKVGDRILIEGTDGVWQDVVTSNDGDAVVIGVNPLSVQDSTDGALYALGTRRKRYDGTEWVYLEADATVAEGDAVIIHKDGGSQPITIALAAVATGLGKKVAVAPSGDLTQAIASGDFYWACVLAPATAGVVVNLGAAAAIYTSLQPHASTAGKLDDTPEADNSFIAGLVITVASGGAEAEIAEINYPFVNDYPQGT